MIDKPRDLSLRQDQLHFIVKGPESHRLDRYLGKSFSWKSRTHLQDLIKDGRVLERTVVVFVADHGEEFKEHGGFGHGLIELLRRRRREAAELLASGGTLTITRNGEPEAVPVLSATSGVFTITVAVMANTIRYSTTM